ncbi:beta-N-acetylhexosaminidase [Neisseria sp. Ec49-e6-T10]|uniref:beta-N-acetylhexosaminidase n=1 Tax=Neisseria sp. Ec49-e6-T10 TaxID=3140744 RepID=UPI003EBD658E
MSVQIQRGPIMADIAGFVLTEEEKERLLDPAIGGVILFRRNFESVKQLRQLTKDIRSLRTPHLVIAVDHEGGRVQRFIDGFTRLPAMDVLGHIWHEQGSEKAKQLAHTIGWVLATELIASGVDLSFTPVLDLGWGNNQVIGNRSFHSNHEVVSILALALQQGLNQAGMSSCGKHFPGHGFVEGDSHYVLPEDHRSLDELMKQDIQPFIALSQENMGAVMPAHVIYTQVCSKAAGFSKIWLQDILRQKIGFDGVIFSDDLTMEGAVSEGTIKQRAKSSFEAGCDIVLVCNRPDLVDELRDDFIIPVNPKLASRWENMSVCDEDIQHAQETLQTEAFIQAQKEVAALSTPKDVAGGVKVGEAY